MPNTAAATAVANLPGEQWRHIPEHEGYMVSNLGRVRNQDRLLKLTAHDRYLGVNLRRTDGTRGQRTVYVHQLMCEVFYGPRPEGHIALFKDGNRSNLTRTNLKWGTRKELGFAGSKKR